MYLIIVTMIFVTVAPTVNYFGEKVRARGYKKIRF